MSNNENIWPYYPETRTTKMLTLDGPLNTTGTILRVKYKGVWYKWIHIISDINEFNAKSRLHSEVYRTILFGKIDIELKNFMGHKVFEKDELQVSEKERLNNQ